MVWESNWSQGLLHTVNQTTPLGCHLWNRLKNYTLKRYPPGNDHISQLGKRKIIFQMPFLVDMLVPWRAPHVQFSHLVYHVQSKAEKKKSLYHFWQPKPITINNLYQLFRTTQFQHKKTTTTTTTTTKNNEKKYIFGQSTASLLAK